MIGAQVGAQVPTLANTSVWPAGLASTLSFIGDVVIKCYIVNVGCRVVVVP